MMLRRGNSSTGRKQVATEMESYLPKLVGDS